MHWVAKWYLCGAVRYPRWMGKGTGACQSSDAKSYKSTRAHVPTHGRHARCRDEVCPREASRLHLHDPRKQHELEQQHPRRPKRKRRLRVRQRPGRRWLRQERCRQHADRTRLQKQHVPLERKEDAAEGKERRIQHPRQRESGRVGCCHRNAGHRGTCETHKQQHRRSVHPEKAVRPDDGRRLPQHIDERRIRHAILHRAHDGCSGINTIRSVEPSHLHSERYERCRKARRRAAQQPSAPHRSLPFRRVRR